MSEPRAVPDILPSAGPEADPSRPQRAASHPEASAWVAASAGSGKTKVLTDRILRLLLAGAAPERILCLTYTKAAAAEMSGRLLKRLARWAALADSALALDLEKLGGDKPGADDLSRARQLFAAVLDCPGGLNIQTIHAFCKTLLARFPCEAGLPPNFRLLEDAAAAQRLHAAQAEAMAAAARNPDSDIGRTLAFLAVRMADKSLDELLRELLGARGKINRALAYWGGCEPLCVELRHMLGLDPADTPETLLNAGLADDALDLEALRDAARILLAGGARDGKKGEILARALADPEQRRRDWPDYARAFFTLEGEPYQTLCTKPLAQKHPHVPDVLAWETRRLQKLRERIAAAALATETSAALRLAESVLAAYEAAKRARGELDYADLVDKSADLLDRVDQADWVLFKLDQGIEHILIDEAQDTSAAQWRIVRALSQDFFAGEGAHGHLKRLPRTLFAVGDGKQSIYGFQGAAPHLFTSMQRYYARCIEASGQDFRPVQMNVSFRSTEPVLRLVDETFAAPDLAAHLEDSGIAVSHRAFREGQAGRVELWPLCRPADHVDGAPDTGDPWSGDAPAPRPGAAQRLAEAIAAQIAHMLETGERLEPAARPLAPGDFLILLRKRGGLMFPIIRALKKRGIACAGADRMALLEQLAVKDLLALGDCLVLPGDDLTLAALLKSPLFDIGEDELFALCHRQGGARETLWQRIRALALDPACPAGLKEKCAAIADYLGALFARTDYVRPYELFLGVLNAPCPADAASGRHAFLSRLGHEIVEPLDDLLDLALRYETAEAPTLQGFLAWIRRVGGTVKREAGEQAAGPRGAGQVRIMTIHGAKGLQAPVVFLAGAAQAGNDRGNLLFYEDPQDYEERGVILPLLPCTKLARSAEAYKNLRAMRGAGAQAEQSRLLYVALTRAADRLYICGAAGKKNQKAPWHDALSEAFARLPQTARQKAPAHLALWGIEDICRIDAPQTAPPDQADGQPPRETARAEPLPAWMARPAPHEPTPSRPLAPSRPAEDDVAVLSPRRPGDRGRLRRGALIHKLLQILPDLPESERASAARRLLSSHAGDMDEAQRRAIAEETLRLFRDPAIADIFGPGGMAEVPIAGLVGDRVIDGRIDRVRIDGNDIWLVDYKTNRAPLSSASAIPPAYIAQMRAYARALRAIYPRHAIHAALVWTAAPLVMPVPDEALA